MTNNGIVTIHGKYYMTVARRLELSHAKKALESVMTEVLSHDPVVVKATITVEGKTFTGISSVSLESAKLIEKQNPYEVAETSAVGRALGFAGFGLIESVASADEVARAVSMRAPVNGDLEARNTTTRTCVVCGEPAIEKKGKTRAGKPYHGVFCSTENKNHTQWL